MAKYNKITFSNSAAALAQTETVDDAALYDPQYFALLTGDPGSATLYSIGNTNTTLTAISGAVSVPSDLLAAYSTGQAYYSDLGAQITISGSTVDYNTATMSAAEKLSIDNLAVGTSPIEDQFYYAIQMSNGTVSWNTVTVNIYGSAANLAVYQQAGSVSEAADWSSPPQNSADTLTEGGAITAFAASGDLTTITVTAAAADLGILIVVTDASNDTISLTAGNSVTLQAGAATDDSDIGALAYHFNYSVPEQTVYATHRGYGEKAFSDTWTITSANGTTETFSEAVYGNIHAPVLSASAASSTIIEGTTVALLISATDNDDNASLTYTISGLAAGATLSNTEGDALQISNGSITLYDDALHGNQLAGLTLTPDPNFVGPMDLSVTASNTEGAAQLSSAPLNIALTIQSNEIIGTPGDDYITLDLTPGKIQAADALGGYDTMVLTGAPTGTVDIDLTAVDQIVSIGGVSEPLVQKNFEAVDAQALVGAAINVTTGADAHVVGTNMNDVISINGSIGPQWPTLAPIVHYGSGDDTIGISGYGATVTPIDPNGTGNDAISVTGDHAYIQSSNGNDTVSLNGMDGGYLGGTGTDIINVQGATTLNNALINYIYCNSGNDVVNVAGDANYVWGNYITVAPGNPITPVATPGDEIVTITGQGNNYFAGGGNNIITVNSTNPSDESIENNVYAGDGNNNITLNGFDTYVLLGNGNNTVNDTGFGSNIMMGNGDNIINATWSGGYYTYGGGSDIINISYNAAAQRGFEINDFVPGTDSLQLHGFTGSVSQTVQATGDPNTTGVEFFIGSGQSGNGSAISIFFRGLSTPLSSQDYTLFA